MIKAYVDDVCLPECHQIFFLYAIVDITYCQVRIRRSIDINDIDITSGLKD